MFKSAFKWAVITISALFLVTGPALAKEYKGGMSPEDLLAETKIFSANASMAIDDNTKEKYIKAKVNDTDVDYTIWLYECEKATCQSIQFHMAFEGDPKKVTDWNKNYRFARAYSTGTNLIHIEYDIDIEAGTNSASIEKGYKRFLLVMLAALTHWEEAAAK